jgi:hypothetical protein
VGWGGVGWGDARDKRMRGGGLIQCEALAEGSSSRQLCRGQGLWQAAWAAAAPTQSNAGRCHSGRLLQRPGPGHPLQAWQGPPGGTQHLAHCPPPSSHRPAGRQAGRQPPAAAPSPGGSSAGRGGRGRSARRPPARTGCRQTPRCARTWRAGRRTCGAGAAAAGQVSSSWTRIPHPGRGGRPHTPCSAGQGNAGDAGCSMEGQGRRGERGAGWQGEQGEQGEQGGRGAGGQGGQGARGAGGAGRRAALTA